MNSTPSDVAQTLERALRTSPGHFVYESGHHGDLWIDLNQVFTDAPRTRAWASELARRARPHAPEVVCGPMVGGAFLAQLAAAELGAQFVFAERVFDDALHYRVPQSLRTLLQGRRVLLVDDAINAGSAARTTAADLAECGAQIVALGTLLLMGGDGRELARGLGVPLLALAERERSLWAPDRCPLCRKGVPLTYELTRD